MAAAPVLTPAEVIERVRAARKAEQEAAFAQVELAALWALLHPCPEGQTPAHWGDADLHDEGLFPLAGPGAPWVAEFAPADLGAALGIPLDAAKELIGDALELRFRLPRLFDLAREGRVPVWRVRGIARQTRDLGVDAVVMADRLIAATPDRIGQVNVERLVQEARLFFDPDRATADEQAALGRRGVWVRHRNSPATTDLTMSLDTLDAELFEQSVARLAGILGDAGDPDDLDVRRARAVGILADPQYALDLMSGRDAAPSSGSRAGGVNLFAHLDLNDLAADLTGATGAVSLERLGAATTELFSEWLGRYAAGGVKITLRPVIDLSADHAVDRHDPPAMMREQVVLRDAHCVFPGCRRDSRACDLDHIVEYVPVDEGGPPGQTRPGNLAPLCRTHHRVKTHTSWDYKRLDDGVYGWTSPTGHQYEVRPSPRLPSR